MVTETMRGVYTILVTPFDQEMRVDTDSLEQLVKYNLNAGVHGLGVALGSEVTALSEAERRLVTRTIVDQVRGRVPVVINTGAPTNNPVRPDRSQRGRSRRSRKPLMSTQPHGPSRTIVNSRERPSARKSASSDSVRSRTASPLRSMSEQRATRFWYDCSPGAALRY